MGIIGELFGKSPFGPVVEHTRKVNECVKLVRPLMEAMVADDHAEVHRLQDEVSKLEYEADQIKHEVREHVQRRYFLPVEKGELEHFLKSQDKIADCVEDFAVILLIRETKIHADLRDEMFEFVDQVLKVSSTLMGAALELQNLAETSFGGEESRKVLAHIGSLGEEEWRADRMQRKLAKHVYELEKDLDPVTIAFYEKILHTLSEIANSAENTGDLLRMMIVRG